MLARLVLLLKPSSSCGLMKQQGNGNGEGIVPGIADCLPQKLGEILLTISCNKFQWSTGTPRRVGRAVVA
ncbi:hypothetical protein AHAS_Ahas19G0240700 [Arachis hypogaea]